MAFLAIQNLSYTYQDGSCALRNINVSLEKGKFYMLVGSTGAGKTTLCLVLSGIIPHILSGEIKGELHLDSLGSFSQRVPSELMGHIGIVFDKPITQLSGIKETVFEEIAFGLENLGVPQKEMHERVESILTGLRLQALKDRSPFSLSGGEQQKVAIASIVVMNPKVLILDEPISQLDPRGRREILHLLGTLKERGVTILCVEHKIEEICEYADYVFVMNKGQIVLEGFPQEVFASDVLDEYQIGTSIYTKAAKEAVKGGIIPPADFFPVTFDEAKIWFARQLWK